MIPRPDLTPALERLLALRALASPDYVTGELRQLRPLERVELDQLRLHLDREAGEEGARIPLGGCLAVEWRGA